ncbi:hypothetical protein HWV62_1498 [Athelia sp. TMB]|nr:hypothetical protein HWV62_1498 [Athelia sp. TMB]
MAVKAKIAREKAAVPKKAGAASKAHPTHPSWADMIKECIIARPDDARFGVSRPTIKKFVEQHYAVEMNAAAASQLNRAIAHGAEKGTFVLPKGASGKVKLATKARGDPTKENSKPAAKAPKATAKKAAPPKVAPARKPMASNRKPPTAVKKATYAKTTAAAKPKAAATKKTTTTVAPAAKSTPAAKQAKPAPKKEAAKPAKKPVAKKTGRERKPSAKAAVTGEAKAKAAAAKPKSKTAKAPTSKTKPASKTAEVPATKAKAASKKA